MPYPPIVLVQPPGSVDHFVGVPAAVSRLGHEVVWYQPGEPWLFEAIRPHVVVVKDTQSLLAIDALRRARGIGATTVLMMDGVLEYRNTFENPFVDEGFLRPAPVDHVMCAGNVDAALMSTWGNRAIATGLPRVHDACPRHVPWAGEGVLIATANRPCFDDAERARLLEAIGQVGASLRERGVPIVWRLTGGLDIDLDVRNDTRPLLDAIRSARAVISTPSTLVIEAMAAGRPVGLMHPHDGPLWQRTLWTWRGYKIPSETPLDVFLDSLLSATPDAMVQQQALLEEQHVSDPPAPENVARFLVSLQGSDGKNRPSSLGEESKRDVIELPAIARMPRSVPRIKGRTRVVNCVGCEGTPVGGVMTWALRLARTFALHGKGYDVRTLAVVIDPSDWKSGGFEVNPDGLTEVCVLDPLMNAAERLETMVKSLERLEPELILPNFTDVAYMAAMQLGARGARSIAIAHSDEPYYRQLASTYSGWSAAVGVSTTCESWLRPIAATVQKPYRTIVYGVPTVHGDRPYAKDGPLKLAYIGRMVEAQKRISDFLTVIDSLEERRVCFELHMVGDGRDLPAWKRDLAKRNLVHGTVIVHGRRDPAWVERFLPTLDASVLLSDFEGTSITMLEAMGAGVVPAVTRVSSGVDEWVRDGVNGIVVPIGAPEQMAVRLEELWRDREATKENGHDACRIERMGRAAWGTVHGVLGLERVAEAYREVFDVAMAQPPILSLSDLGLRPMELTRWIGSSADDGTASDAACARMLSACGYRRIGSNADILRGGSVYDSVLVGSNETPPSTKEIEDLRERGIGVAISPGLVVCSHEHRMGGMIDQLLASGAERIALYGTGLHTRRLLRLFRQARWNRYPFVGFIDDRVPNWPQLFGLPITRPSDAIEVLGMDTVVLSSDVHEDRMWEKSELLRERGVRVVRMYDTDTEIASCARLGAGEYESVQGITPPMATRR